MSPSTFASEHVAENRRHWNESAPDWIASGERSWDGVSACWGQWSIPESELRLLPDDMTGMHAIELGCGTGYVSAWMTRLGANAVGVDVSEEQLRTAKRLRAKHRLDIELIHGNAEVVPKPDASFDFAISEYGAALWADPYLWVPEAHRLLRCGGRLVFLSCHPLALICSPLDGSNVCEHLHRPYFGMHRFDWTRVEVDPGGIEFNLTIGDWLKLLTDTGFEVEAFVELQCPRDSPDTPFAVSARWAHRYPSEMVWKARKA
ncbi:MAG: class I SAM-dependent methyltransferase [Gammaproteobacteria bacterium]